MLYRQRHLRKEPLHVIQSVMIRLAKNAHQGKTFYLWRVTVGFVVVFFVFLNLRLAFITEFEGPTGHYMLGHDLDTPSAIAVKNEYEHPTESFSACILWMDDNHRLEEWLAYHYYVMKLRYVVVNVDPKSKTSPKEIFDRWNDHENRYKLNMTIVKMSDSDYIPDFSVRMDALEELILSNTSDSTKLYGTEKTNYHRFRQRQFYKACSQHLVEQNKSWYGNTKSSFCTDDTGRYAIYGLTSLSLFTQFIVRSFSCIIQDVIPRYR